MADFFPGFIPHRLRLDTTASDSPSLFFLADSDNTKLPLLLVHGFPQTHIEFHKIVPYLKPHFSLVLVDLRGYGASSTVESKNGSGYSKRIMAKDCVTIMSHLGYEKFSILGHDRGARVAYRLAFDTPEKVDKVIVVDIIPTHAMYTGFGDVSAGLRAYHWLFLAQPEPFPETMIQAADRGKYFLEHTLASWTAKQSLEDFDVAALEAYREAYCSESRIHSACEDYRAGAFLDHAYDEEDVREGRKISVPLLAIWGQNGLFAAAMEANSTRGPLQVWQEYAENVTGVALDARVECFLLNSFSRPQTTSRELKTKRKRLDSRYHDCLKNMLVAVQNIISGIAKLSPSGVVGNH